MTAFVFYFAGLTCNIAPASAAYSPPPIESGYKLFLAIAPEQLDQMLDHENYPTDLSPNGVCYGLTQLNYLLLTKTRFEPEAQTKDSDDEIYRKLMTAFGDARTPGPEITLAGYSESEFKYEFSFRRWNTPENPVQKAIQEIQTRQGNIRTAMFMFPRITFGATRGSRLQEALYLKNILLQGYPISIGMGDITGRHYARVVGLISKSEENLEPGEPETVPLFLVADSAHPEELQILELREKKVSPHFISNTQKLPSLLALPFHPELDSHTWFYPSWEVRSGREKYRGEVFIGFFPPSEGELQNAKEKLNAYESLTPIVSSRTHAMRGN